MGVKLRSFRQRGYGSYSPILASALRSNNSIVTLPPGSINNIAASQAFSTFASNSVAVANPTLINPVLLNGAAGGFIPIDPNAKDRGVYLPLPTCPVIQMTGNSNFPFTVRWRGINHLGRPVYFTERKTHIAGAGAPYFQSICAFSYIDTCEILEWEGATTDGVVIGNANNFAQSGAGLNKRFPVPFPFDSASDLVGLSVLDTSGATWSTAIAVGDTKAVGTVDLCGRPASPAYQTALFTMTNATVEPTSTWRVSIMQKHTSRITGGDNMYPVVV